MELSAQTQVPIDLLEEYTKKKIQSITITLLLSLEIYFNNRYPTMCYYYNKDFNWSSILSQINFLEISMLNGQNIPPS